MKSLLKTKICSSKFYQMSLLLLLRDIGVFESLLTSSELDRYSEACRRFVNFVPPVNYSDMETLGDMHHLKSVVLLRRNSIYI